MSDGKVGGYFYGSDKKRELLEKEGISFTNKEWLAILRMLNQSSTKTPINFRPRYFIIIFNEYNNFSS